MNISIYGKTFNPTFFPYFRQVYDLILQHNGNITLYAPFLKYVQEATDSLPAKTGQFSSLADFPSHTDLILSIGGDGTFLDTLPFALKNNIPVVGINSGRLGFLANIAKEDINSSFEAIFSGKYSIEYRSLLEVISPDALFEHNNYALNEITIQKQGASMVNIEVFLEEEFLNNYWTDGLIISTPTGSTAYSLSVGGPIVHPGSETLILAPIASHNLTVRPMVIPDDYQIRIKFSSRENRFIVTADSRTVELVKPIELVLKKSEKRLKMLLTDKSSFYTTIRNKLMWGVDKRN